MVFYDNRHRHRRQKPKVEPPNGHLRHLSHDLIYMILELLPTPDLLKARLVCSSLTSVGNSVVAKRMTRLYIHPSTRALHNALKICRHPVWNQNITEVVLLSVESCTHPVLSMYDAWKLNVARQFWPSYWAEPHRSLGPEDTSFSLIRILIEAFARLPKLEKLSWDSKVGECGFNQVAQSTLWSYAQKCGKRHMSVDFTQYLHSMEVFLILLFAPQLPFSACRLSHGFAPSSPCAGVVAQWITPKPLKSIELHLTHIGFTGTAFDMLLAPSPSAGNSIDCAYSKGLWPLSMVETLTHHPPPLLASLTISQGSRSQSTTARSPRPVVWRCNLPQFLRNNFRTLCSFNIDNVLCFWTEKDRKADCLELARELLRTLAALPKLRETTWRVADYRHSPRCKEADDAPFTSRSCQRNYCANYSGWNDPHSPNRDDFAQFAAEEGLESENGYWDFGKSLTLRRRFENEH